MKLVFYIDIETCQVSGGAVRIIIEDQMVIEKILNYRDAKAAELETRGWVAFGLWMQKGL